MGSCGVTVNFRSPSLKSSLTGDEPSDVTEYHARCPAFPHETTADQFFSESQFESYRRLGLHVVDDAFEELILKLAQALDSDAEELLFMAQKIPPQIRERVLQRPDAFRKLARLDDHALDRVLQDVENTSPDDPAKRRKAAAKKG